MSGVLPTEQKLQWNQPLGTITDAQIAALDALVLILPDSARQGAWPKFPHADWLRRQYQAAGKNAPAPLVVNLPNPAATRVCLGFLAPDAQAFHRLELARQLVGAALGHNPARLGILALTDEAPAMTEATAAALLAAVFPMPVVKQEAPTAVPLKTVSLLGLAKKLDLARTRAEAAGNNLARWLAVLPGNHLTPALYHRKLDALAKREGWQFNFLGETELKRQKAGAFLAVCQGSATRDAGIAHLRYTPAKRGKRPGIALVGKGICFDTGGTNLKGAKGMFGMHGDMQGSAVALGTLLALSRLNVDFPIDCWLAISENRIGPAAYKQNDVVVASNGVSIEITHTDAEGRMVLSDTLALASKAKPAALLDYATLTGTCVHSLGTRYSGAFTNRIELVQTLIQCGRDSGERVWPFPNDNDYDKQLESSIADIKQCLIEGEADHILASRFLNRFVEPSVPWVHLDLAASENKGGLAHVPSEATGFGVRYSLNLLLDKKFGSAA